RVDPVDRNECSRSSRRGFGQGQGGSSGPHPETPPPVPTQAAEYHLADRAPAPGVPQHPPQLLQQRGRQQYQEQAQEEGEGIGRARDPCRVSVREMVFWLLGAATCNR